MTGEEENEVEQGLKKQGGKGERGGRCGEGGGGDGVEDHRDDEPEMSPLIMASGFSNSGCTLPSNFPDRACTLTLN